MNVVVRRFCFPLILLVFSSCGGPAGNDNTVISMKTTLGEIRVRLYDSIPLHKANFLKLVNMGFYDGISFHRVINNFMIQAGDPVTRTGLTKEQLDTLGTYTIPAEFRSGYFHRKGALAAAREGNDVNPEMRSSGTQFYIVQGVKQTDEDLNKAEARINSNLKQALFEKLIREVTDSALMAGATLQESEIQEQASIRMFNYISNHGDFKFSEDQRNIYRTIGGVPRLDQTYTVFGEVTEGLDVVDKIAAVPTDSSDKPLSDVKIIKMRIVSR